jgi:hypothetical protein
MPIEGKLYGLTTSDIAQIALMIRVLGWEDRVEGLVLQSRHRAWHPAAPRRADRASPARDRQAEGWGWGMTDIDAERRIHLLEEQLRTARDDALEEAAKVAERLEEQGSVRAQRIARNIRKLKGTPA